MRHIFVSILCLITWLISDSIESHMADNDQQSRDFPYSVTNSLLITTCAGRFAQKTLLHICICRLPWASGLDGGCNNYENYWVIDDLSPKGTLGAF